MIITQEKPLILLVDDVPANLHILAEMLRADHRIKTATNGLSALEISARPDKPALILLDVMMPGMSGIEVLRHLREKPETNDIPVIFVSADVSEQSQLEGLALGADEYLTKPVISNILRIRVRNLLQRKRAEAQLRLASHVFEYSGEAIVITDHNNNIIDVNPAFTRMTGYTGDEVKGMNPNMLSSGRTSEDEYHDMWWSIMEKGFWRGEVWDRCKDGSVYPKLLTISVVRNVQGKIDFHIASFADLSQQKAAEEKIRYTAHHDALTGLPNRLHLKINLEQILATAKRENQEIALMFIDLDRFKLINDTLGHHIGDGLLIEVARRLHDCVRESDILARLGGDEFVVAIFGKEVHNQAISVAKKVLGSLSHPYQIQSHQLYSSPSIGIAFYPHDSTNIESLMKNADTAMYQAKSYGRNNFQVFNESMNQSSKQRLEMENNLHIALEKNEFMLFFQPQVDFNTGNLVGAEALIRWHHPTHGMVLPQQFIPLAEENGMIIPIGDWVLHETCRQIKHWYELGLDKLRFAINLSPRQFRQENLVHHILHILNEFELPPSCLELEITETSIMENAGGAVTLLHELDKNGFSIAIDDFGTGYSSLNYLKRFPVNKLKIDKSFVQDIPDDPDDSAIATAIIHLGLSLGLKVVAEGVENEQQWQFLRDRGCDLLQGYWYSMPLNVQQFTEFALTHKRTD